MKVRTGFVSNSSTSSFICEICGEEAVGWDLCCEEAEMFQCENGHTMCQEHAISDLKINGKTQEEVENEEDSDGYFELECIDEACCPICNYQEISYGDARRFLLKEYGIPEDLVFQKIKEVNKRRKKLYDEEYVKYVFDEKGLNDDSYIAMIKERFPSYKDYRKYEGKV